MRTALEHERTAIARAAPERTPFALFTGGKGGVGKTLLAANTAIEIASRGAKVLLVDLDLGLADLDVVLGLTCEHTIEDALAGRVTLAECVVRGPGGVRVLASSSGSHSMGRLDAATRSKLFAEIAALARGYDLVVADSGAGIGPDVLDACVLADHVFVVTTPEPAALTDAYGLIKALHTWSVEHGRDVPTPELVVNQASSVEQAEFTAAKLRSVCERFLARSPRSAGWMPNSPVLARSACAQRPFALERGTQSSAPGAPRRREVDSADIGLPWGCLTRLAARVERLCLGSVHPVLPQGVVSRGR